MICMTVISLLNTTHDEKKKKEKNSLQDELGCCKGIIGNLTYGVRQTPAEFPKRCAYSDGVHIDINNCTVTICINNN